MIDTKKRIENLEFSKQRAFEILEREQNSIEAWTSFLSDMTNCDETRDHPAIGLGMVLMMGGGLSTVPEMKKFIEDCN